MTREQQIRFWLIGLGLLLVAMYFLSSVMLPFAAGMAVAYLLDPTCDKLESWGLSRIAATVIVTLAFVVLLLLFVLLLGPLLVGQLIDLLQSLPEVVDNLHKLLQSVLASLQERFGTDILDSLRDSMKDRVGSAVEWATKVLGQVISGGVALVNLLSLVFITPIVAFYLLRDWDKMVAKIDSWLPRHSHDTIVKLAKDADAIIASFIRGQALVCLILGGFYMVGLMLAGLKYGLIVGLVSGLLSFIPFVGSITGLVLSVGLALLQFDDLVRVAIVAGIFFLGQFLEGNFITPKFVGDSTQLHPVWVIFALLAGGALFGFLGVLLAIPVAAVIGVLVRFSIKEYLKSPLYGGEAPAGIEENGGDEG
ncbi:AI-2E family transporter [Limibacillus halophilus]|jgi:predicted PurR-regulated permease PerM